MAAQQHAGPPSLRQARFILGFPAEDDITENGVQKAYKRLALVFHPDKNLDESEVAKGKFQQVVAARDVLVEYCRRNKSILHRIVYEATTGRWEKNAQQGQGGSYGGAGPTGGPGSFSAGSSASGSSQTSGGGHNFTGWQGNHPNFTPGGFSTRPSAHPDGQWKKAAADAARNYKESFFPDGVNFPNSGGPSFNQGPSFPQPFGGPTTTRTTSTARPHSAGGVTTSRGTGTTSGDQYTSTSSADNKVRTTVLKHQVVWECAACKVSDIAAYLSNQRKACVHIQHGHKCFCGHPFSGHKLVKQPSAYNDSFGGGNQGKTYKCTDCACENFQYVPNGWLCSCGHGPEDHSPLPPFSCLICGPKACSQFHCFKLCETCGHNFICHQTTIECQEVYLNGAGEAATGDLGPDVGSSSRPNEDQLNDIRNANVGGQPRPRSATASTTSSGPPRPRSATASTSSASTTSTSAASTSKSKSKIFESFLKETLGDFIADPNRAAGRDPTTGGKPAVPKMTARPKTASARLPVASSRLTSASVHVNPSSSSGTTSKKNTGTTSGGGGMSKNGTAGAAAGPSEQHQVEFPVYNRWNQEPPSRPQSAGAARRPQSATRPASARPRGRGEPSSASFYSSSRTMGPGAAGAATPTSNVEGNRGGKASSAATSATSSRADVEDRIPATSSSSSGDAKRVLSRGDIATPWLRAAEEWKREQQRPMSANPQVSSTTTTQQPNKNKEDVNFTSTAKDQLQAASSSMTPRPGWVTSEPPENHHAPPMMEHSPISVTSPVRETQPQRPSSAQGYRQWVRQRSSKQAAASIVAAAYYKNTRNSGANNSSGGANSNSKASLSSSSTGTTSAKATTGSRNFTSTTSAGAGTAISAGPTPRKTNTTTTPSSTTSTTSSRTTIKNPNNPATSVTLKRPSSAQVSRRPSSAQAAKRNRNFSVDVDATQDAAEEHSLFSMKEDEQGVFVVNSGAGGGDSSCSDEEENHPPFVEDDDYTFSRDRHLRMNMNMMKMKKVAPPARNIKTNENNNKISAAKDNAAFDVDAYKTSRRFPHLEAMQEHEHEAQSTSTTFFNINVPAAGASRSPTKERPQQVSASSSSENSNNKGTVGEQSSSPWKTERAFDLNAQPTRFGTWTSESQSRPYNLRRQRDASKSTSSIEEDIDDLADPQQHQQPKTPLDDYVSKLEQRVVEMNSTRSSDKYIRQRARRVVALRRNRSSSSDLRLLRGSSTPDESQSPGKKQEPAVGQGAEFSSVSSGARSSGVGATASVVDVVGTSHPVVAVDSKIMSSKTSVSGQSSSSSSSSSSGQGATETAASSSSASKSSASSASSCSSSNSSSSSSSSSSSAATLEDPCSSSTKTIPPTSASSSKVRSIQHISTSNKDLNSTAGSQQIPVLTPKFKLSEEYRRRLYGNNGGPLNNSRSNVTSRTVSKAEVISDAEDSDEGEIDYLFKEEAPHLSSNFADIMSDDEKIELEEVDATTAKNKDDTTPGAGAVDTTTSSSTMVEVVQVAETREKETEVTASGFVKGNEILKEDIVKGSDEKHTDTSGSGAARKDSKATVSAPSEESQQDEKPLPSKPLASTAANRQQTTSASATSCSTSAASSTNVSRSASRERTLSSSASAASSSASASHSCDEISIELGDDTAGAKSGGDNEKVVSRRTSIRTKERLKIPSTPAFGGKLVDPSSCEKGLQQPFSSTKTPPSARGRSSASSSIVEPSSAAKLLRQLGTPLFGTPLWGRSVYRDTEDVQESDFDDHSKVLFSPDLESAPDEQPNCFGKNIYSNRGSCTSTSIGSGGTSGAFSSTTTTKKANPTSPSTTTTISCNRMNKNGATTTTSRTTPSAHQQKNFLASTPSVIHLPTASVCQQELSGFDEFAFTDEERDLIAGLEADLGGPQTRTATQTRTGVAGGASSSSTKTPCGDGDSSTVETGLGKEILTTTAANLGSSSATHAGHEQVERLNSSTMGGSSSSSSRARSVSKGSEVSSSVNTTTGTTAGGTSTGGRSASLRAPKKSPRSSPRASPRSSGNDRKKGRKSPRKSPRVMLANANEQHHEHVFTSTKDGNTSATNTRRPTSPNPARPQSARSARPTSAHQKVTVAAPTRTTVGLFDYPETSQSTPHRGAKNGGGAAAWDDNTKTSSSPVATKASATLFHHHGSHENKNKPSDRPAAPPPVDVVFLSDQRSQVRQQQKREREDRRRELEQARAEAAEQQMLNQTQKIDFHLQQEGEQQDARDNSPQILRTYLNRDMLHQDDADYSSPTPVVALGGRDQNYRRPQSAGSRVPGSVRPQSAGGGRTSTPANRSSAAAPSVFVFQSPPREEDNRRSSAKNVVPPPPPRSRGAEKLLRGASTSSSSSKRNYNGTSENDIKNSTGGVEDAEEQEQGRDPDHVEDHAHVDDEGDNEQQQSPQQLSWWKRMHKTWTAQRTATQKGAAARADATRKWHRKKKAVDDEYLNVEEVGGRVSSPMNSFSNAANMTAGMSSPGGGPRSSTSTRPGSAKNRSWTQHEWRSQKSAAQLEQDLLEARGQLFASTATPRGTSSTTTTVAAGPLFTSSERSSTTLKQMIRQRPISAQNYSSRRPSSASAGLSHRQVRERLEAQVVVDGIRSGEGEDEEHAPHQNNKNSKNNQFIRENRTITSILKNARRKVAAGDLMRRPTSASTSGSSEKKRGRGGSSSGNLRVEFEDLFQHREDDVREVARSSSPSPSPTKRLQEQAWVTGTLHDLAKGRVDT
ncbi:unnamed protein product [Amoebophrya sp. A25]|nr:unnamed protein product [Amoebophrya sp. A25]|eukprot:GSA25T00007198001.1